MSATKRLSSGKFGSSKMVCVVFAFCVATARMSPGQSLTTLVNFTGPNGAEPRYESLVEGTDGNFYGTTRGGGVSSRGTVFKMTPSGTLTTLYSFCGQPNCTDGGDPDAGLVLGNDGNFYGATTAGGASGDGTIFKITPSGGFTSLHSFAGSDGDSPAGTLLQATDGNFYGTTQAEGAHGFGTVFKITSDGTLTTIYNFCTLGGCRDGGTPFAGLVQGNDGNFYGTTSNGGAGAVYGTVFRITSSGTLGTLHSFDGPDGSAPYGKLVQATDGNFYGTTSSGGGSPNCTFGCGTIFKITPSGSFTSLHSFSFTDGSYIIAGVIQATDGNFYGTAGYGGDTQNCGNGCGTIFEITAAGTLTTLHSLVGFPTEGSLPVGGLLQASSGTFYGTAEAEGSTGDGAIFSLSTGIDLSPVQFMPATPCRLADTRSGSPIQGGTWEVFVVPQLGDCNIPANAAAYSLNVTVVPHGPLGYLTIWPAGRPQPFVSTMNSYDGRVKANAAIVPAGAGGAVSVYVSNTSDVILDIDGYFAPASAQTLQFYPLTPCRVVDTRDSMKPQGLGPPFLANMETRDLPIPLSPCVQGLPNHPQAYSFNVTVVPDPGGPLNYLTVWPSDQTQPLVSTLNNPTATVVANAAIVPAAATGNIKVFAYNSTDVIMDINGYFAAPGSGGYSLYPVAPCRAYDSRNSGGPFQGELTVSVVGSACAPPASAQAYVFNATVVPTNGPMGYLTLWPDGETQPIVSTLNAYDGYVTSNMAIVPNMNGSIDAYAAGLTQLILDISGYFAP